MPRPVLITLWCAFALGPVHAAAEAGIVVVEPGDALSLIAERNGVSVPELRAWNRLESDLIRVGQRLRVEPGDAVGDDGIDWTPPFDYGDSPSEAVEPHSAPIAAKETSVAIASTRGKGTRPKGRTYRVKPGDTLTGIARRFDTTIAELTKTNPNLDPDVLYPGQPIDIGEPRPEVRFRLERGDSLLAVAVRHDVSTRDLARWNSNVRRGAVTAGQEIRLYTRIPVSPSEAVGPTNRGRLRNAVVLPPHPGYVIRSRAVAYGTEETIRWVVDAFNAVDSRFKTRKAVRVHDISDRKGGRIRNHKSHQNGRDVDISYYQKTCPRSGCPVEKLRASELDIARQWTLLEHWLKNDQAELIFIDYRLQARLYRHAKRRGVSEAQLRRWIQYPRGKYEPVGVIRHFRNHQDHLHVRFVCPYSDLRCRR